MMEILIRSRANLISEDPCVKLVLFLFYFFKLLFLMSYETDKDCDIFSNTMWVSCIK